MTDYQGNTPPPFQRVDEPLAQPPSEPPEQKRGGLGCLVPFFLALFMAAVLVGVALLLPPFSLLERLTGTQYVLLDAQSNAARSGDEGLTLIIDPSDPGEAFGVALGSVSQDAFAADLTGTGSAARAAIPASLSLASPVYTLETTGIAPDTVTLSMTLPNTVPDADLLDAYTWDGTAWRFLPTQPVDATTLITRVDTVPGQLALFQAAGPSAPVVVVPVDVTQTLTANLAGIASIVTPGGIQPTQTGAVTGSLAAGVASNAGYRLMPAVRNFNDPRALDVDTVTAILSNRTLRRDHIDSLATLASAYNGLFIDYRGLPDDQRENFSAFIVELGAALQARNLQLGVVVPPAQNRNGSWETGAYDWRALGAVSNYVQVNIDRVDPTMFAPGRDRLVEAMLRWGTGEVSRYKLIVGLSAQSQLQASGGFTPIGYGEALSPLGNVRVSGDLTEDGGIIPGQPFTAELDGLRAVPGEDEATQTAYIDYLDDNDNPITRVWLTTDEALAFRLARTREFAVGGVAFTDIVRGDLADGVPTAIANYKLDLPFEPTQTELYLQWRVENSAGVIAEATTELNAPFEATVIAPEGNYAVNVAVVAESERARGGVAVALAAPTATPTPLPSPTPRPTATPTATPDPEAVAAAQIQATQQAAAARAANPGGGNFSASAPGAGSIQAGAFEYGGHVTSTGSARAANAMRTAGMTWMKVQVRYSPGDNGASVGEAINAAKSQGFKVLIGTVGSPAELGFRQQGYIEDYARWLGDVARQAPDAIEVWNEPNIDREWPRGQISGAAYTAMLRVAYSSIKSANPGVLVISGAPAPTGAESAFPGQVMNDDRWLRQVVDAGGLQYMDCVGMHYNEGIVPPSARSGDPRDNYYTRYLGSMLDTYWGIVGGQKPICITELGYLTSEGYPSLPPFFSWASNVTLQQQSAWAAQAIAQSSQSGRVRLLIIWNIDFTVYGSDPQGGYAIIRPDGSCPACNAIAAAR